MNKFLKNGLPKFLLILLLVSQVAFATVTRTFSWTPPTAWTNGDVLTDSQIVTYNLWCSTSTDSNFWREAVPNTGNTDNFVAVDVFPAGDYSCVATTVANDGTGLVESVFSNIVTFSVSDCQAVECKPNPPILNPVQNIVININIEGG